MQKRARTRGAVVVIVMGAGCAMSCGGPPAKPSLQARATQQCATEATVEQCEALLTEATERVNGCETGPKDAYWAGCGTQRRTRADIATQLGRIRDHRTANRAAPSDAPATAAPTAPHPPTDTNAPGEVPTPGQVQAAATAAATKAPPACGVSNERALITATVEVAPSGEIADAKLSDASVGSPSLLECVRKAFADLKFAWYKMPADANASWRHEGSASWPIYLCSRGGAGTFHSCRAVMYEITLMLGSDGSAVKPTRDQIRAFNAESATVAKKADQDARDAACAATRGSGFPAGAYSGQASQNVTGKDGSKVRGWKSLTIKVDANGCATWRGYDAGDIWVPGDEARDLQKINTTCITDGDAAITKTPSGFKLTAKTLTKRAGGAPTRFHVWKCPGGNVQTPMSVDLAGKHCVMLGNAADAQEELAGEFVCRKSDPFGELADRAFTLDKDGSMRLPLTIVDPSTIVLHRIDSKQ